MIRLVLIIIIFCMPSLVFANPVAYRQSFNNSYHATAKLACEAMLLNMNNQGNGTWTYDSVDSNNVCIYTRDNPPYTGVFNFGYTATPQFCPSNTVWNNINYTCDPIPVCTLPQVLNPQTNQCETPNPCQQLQGKPTSWTNNTPSSTACKNNCVVQVEDGNCGTNSQGQTGCFYTGSYTNQTCNSNTSEVPPSPEFECVKNGQSYGTINGSVVCVDAGTPDTPPVETVSKNNKTVNNPDGTTTTTNITTSVTNNNVTTTTTTTTTPAGGGQPTTATETKQQDKKSFCEENPNLEICKTGEGSGKSFGGGCGSFTCKGDAIQCAIAKKQHQDRCDDLAENSQTNLGTSLLSGIPISGNPLANENSQIIDLPTSLEKQVLLPKACLPDYTHSLGGRAITIPFSKLCGGLEAIGTIVQLFAYLIGAMIIFRRKY